MKKIYVIIGIIVLIGTGAVIAWLKTSATPSPQPSFLPSTSSAVISTPLLKSKQFTVSSIPQVSSAYAFSATIPSTWQIEAVLAIEAINIFDPVSPEKNNLEKSQIFIRYFRANSFLTLSTVDILNKVNLTINDRPAIRYEIQKKPGIPPFPHQPLWRNGKHSVTDIRASTTNPSLFYVIAKAPSLDEEIYQQFLHSLKIP